MQETQFDPWSRKIPHATERLRPGATTIEPVFTSLEPQLLSLCATATEACALQQDKPPQWEAHALQLERTFACHN